MVHYTIQHETYSRKEQILNAFSWTLKHWFQITLALFALHIFLNKDINIQVNFNDKQEVVQNSHQPSTPPKVEAAIATPTSLKVEESTFNTLATALPLAKPAVKKTKPIFKGSDFNNLSFILNPDYASKKGVSDAIVNEKLEICQKYVERFAAVAIAEMKKYQIPASITLAQGLLETSAGASKLATESNNHFGIKCRTKCKGCTCRNYSDDDVYDMFRVFGTAWESYREHSILLSSKRYRHLKDLDIKDYRLWAYGLKKAGYATDKRYAEKLIQIIEALDLYQFDK